MIALIDVELRRALARRLVRFTALLALIGIVTAALVVFFRTSDTEPERGGVIGPPPALIQECIANPFEFGIDPGLPDAERARDCQEQLTFVEFERDSRYHLFKLKDTFAGMIVPLVILAWLLGASLVGAEWRAGTMGTLLTWESRRTRVLVAKAIAATVIGVAFFILVQSLLGLALLPSALFHGTTEGFDLGEVVRFLARGTLLAAVGALIGFALGSIGRNTTMAMAAGFIYLAVLEGGLLGALFEGIRRWLIVGNSVVLMTGGSPDIPGRSQTGAAILLTLYGIGAVTVALAAIRARDVAA